MTYSKLLLYFGIPAFTVVLTVLSLQNKSLSLLRSDFLYTFLIFYAIWWLADWIAVTSKIWNYSSEKISFWLGGIPFEDHLVALFIVSFVTYLLEIFK